MKTMKHLLLVLVALALALTTAPAIADSDRNEGFRDGHRFQRQEFERHDRERQEHEREVHERREHRDFRFAYRVPYAAPYCYRQDGYWAWNGWQYVWVPSQTICE